MPRKDVRDGIIGVGLLTGILFATDPAVARSPVTSTLQSAAWPSPQSEARFTALGGSIDPIQQLVRMSPEQLNLLYQQAAVGPIPTGKARGSVLFKPGTALASPLSKASKVVWQGKVFNADASSAVNKFFGIRIIRANVSYGESWMDGEPSIILDYSSTSLVYANYRDELREVAPGLFLGLMYARTSPQPTFKMYFALQVP